MIDDAVRIFLQENRVGVLGTLRPDGSMRQSVVYYAIDGDRLLISTESTRAKTRDITRDHRASLCVLGTSPPFPSATLEGSARIRTTAISPDTATVMARIPGLETAEPPSEDALAATDRVIVEITIDRIYSVSHINTD